MNMKQDKFKELREKTIAAQNKFKDAIANGNYDEEKMKAIYSEIDWMYSRMMQEMDYLYSTIANFANEHLKGHLPPIKTTSGMEKALNALGMGDDYEVYKPSISVAKTRNGVQLTATYKK